MEAILQNDSDQYARVKLFWSLSYEILNRDNNDPETEQNFRKVCSSYKKEASDLLLNQAYQECISAYQKSTSTYLFNLKSNLYIYDTESEREEVKVLKFREEIFSIYLITQLSNGELFFTGKNKFFDERAFIIDRYYQVRELPTYSSKRCLMAIYLNKNIYWFGYKSNCSKAPYLSQRFDLVKNRWIELAQTHFKRIIYTGWNITIFNGNILISIQNRKNLLLYSIDIDSFSEIPYSFANNIRKILINAEKKLYIIECKENGYIYESEAENEYFWKRIGNSIIPFDADQVYCSYNKEGIYISISHYKIREYFKFDLSKKSLIEIAYYSKHLALKRLENKIEAIECYGHAFKLDYEHALTYINETSSLHNIVTNLEKIKLHPNNADY